MTITFNEKNQTFHLSNSKISYVIAIEEDRYLSHHYWGKKINDVRSKADQPRREMSHFAVPDHLEHRQFSLGVVQQEYPGADIGDHREYAYRYKDSDG